MKHYIYKLKKGFFQGIGIALGLGTMTLLAVSLGTINTFTSGTPVNAAKVNENFASLKTALESIPNWTKNGTTAEYLDGNIRVNGKISSSVLGTYCGNTSSLGTTGSFVNGATAGSINYNSVVGYRGAKAACEAACGNTNAHMCSSHEMAISAQMNIISSISASWYTVSIAAQYPSSYQAMQDCIGWTNNSNTQGAHAWATSGGGSFCDAYYYIACCL